ncbi:MAG TPA: 3-oxoacyl-[acyl-carrier-protein] synthase III C-terminal domain-containing protein [Opitutaceae bacterium]|jgi:predicted naringenin-chalcone synthase|nr:3-oxoacyl-[acyl-carrier-protein] synthase III C-terminal domain-containing protein [Opitutaceae bacterium]
MYLHGLATANPPTKFSQQQCWEIAQHSPTVQRLNERAQFILQKVLTGDNGIATRYFALSGLDQIFDLGSDQLNAAFRTEAPKLALAALRPALEQARVRPADLDALLICTCTGYLCPGLTSYVAEQLGLRTDAWLQDLVGLGCGAAIPMLRAAGHVLAARPQATVACVAVEVCSAAFYLDNDPGVIISACLFGDGAAATVWRATPGPTGQRCFEFNTLHWPADREQLRFEMRDGKLRNLLHRSVPEVSARAAAQLWSQRSPRPVEKILSHAGGRDVLTGIEAAVPGYPLVESARVLRDCGNMSSPSVLFALADAMRSGPPDAEGDFWLVSFGAGFSAHCCRLGVTE